MRKRERVKFKCELPETVVEGIRCRNHANVHGTILPDSIVGQHLYEGKQRAHQHIHNKSCQELVNVLFANYIHSPLRLHQF